MEEPSQHHGWIHPAKARYYQVYLDRDLFGDWTLRKVWGGINSSRGRMHNTGTPSYDDGMKQIHEIAKRRVQRGYQRVFLPPLGQSFGTWAISPSAGAQLLTRTFRTTGGGFFRSDSFSPAWIEMPITRSMIDTISQRKLTLHIQLSI